MEDLVKALRNIALALPDHDQLLQLSDPDPEIQSNLVRHLALSSAATLPVIQDESEDSDESDAASFVSQDPLIDADLFTGAVQALLDNYNKSIDKERDALRSEYEQLAAPKKFKVVPLKALLARQAAEITKRREEVYAASHDVQTGQQLRTFYLPRQTFEGLGNYVSSKPFHELNRIDIDEFEAPRRFEGRYVLCKVASSLNLYVACTFIVVLPSGKAIPVSIAHFTSNLHLSGSELDACLPIGTVLAIKEPYVSLNHYAKGGHSQGGKNVVGIRVDTPTDVHIVDGLDSVDSRLMAEVTWKADGHESQNDYSRDPLLILNDSPAKVHAKGCRWLQDGPLSRLAVSAHTLPDLAAGHRAQLRSNTRQLIESFLAENRPGAAYRELIAARLLGCNEATLTAIGEDLALEGHVLRQMSRFAQSRIAFEAAMQSCPIEKREMVQENIFESLNAVRTAQKASALGPTHENVWSYYFESDSYATPRFDIQDWLGPLAVQDIPGAGRGMVLTQDVEEGELLLCCKAAASSYALDPGCKGIHLLRYTVETGVTSTTTQVLAATKAIHAMIDRPDDFVLPIMGLTAGPGTKHSPWVAQPYPVPPKRTFSNSPQREAQELLQEVQSPDEVTKQRWRSLLERSSTRPSISSNYVDGVLRFNAFGPAANPGSHSNAEEGSTLATSELFRSTMVHPLPAILNHACEPNVSSVFFGDIVTTRALHPLKKGNEIMHQYVKGEQPYRIRQSQLSKHGFQCNCGICQLDEQDGEQSVRLRNKLVLGSFGMLEERSRILLKSTELRVDDHKDLVGSLLDLIAKVQATYHASRPTLRPDLLKILQLASLHQSKYDVDLAVNTELQALETSGAKLSTSCTTRLLDALPLLNWNGSTISMLTLSRLMLQKEPAEQDEAKRWAEQAFYMHQCTIGGGADIFLDRWNDAFQDLPLRQWLPRS